MKVEGSTFLDPATHPRALSARAAEALLAGNPAEAYAMADRRCRITPAAEVEDHLLRAEAAFRLGHRMAALADVHAALAIEPNHVLGNRKLLAWGSAGERARSARVLLCHGTEKRDLDAALAAFRVKGKQGVLRAVWSCDRLEGWAAWRGGGPISLNVAWPGEAVEYSLEPDTTDPLACFFGSAAHFAYPWPSRVGTVRLTTEPWIDLLTREVRQPFTKPLKKPLKGCVAHRASAQDRVTVIIPVYRDVDATRACLESLLLQADQPIAHDVLVVDDASPEPEMRSLLDRFMEAGTIRCLTNPRNLGFVGAVNRALAVVEEGDVVLLNADTVVPKGCLDRLIAASRLEPRIGTVIPLSNNGEFVSFPRPFTENPLPTWEVIEQLDRMAARVNVGRLHDVPSGIGFCMLITRSCLDAVGNLDSSIERGYLEDVDFCLRARRAGYRNVCAPFVYVGHAGSRSFGTEKRALVTRNMRTLDRRYPHYRPQVSAFLRSDPLRGSRARLETAMASRLRFDVLVCGGHDTGCLAGRAQAAARKGDRVLIGEASISLGHYGLSLRSLVGDVPQNLIFDLSNTQQVAAALDFLHQVGITRAELVEPSPLPTDFVQALRGAGIGFDLYLAGADPAPHPNTVECAADLSETKIVGGASSFGPHQNCSKFNEYPQRLRALASQSQRVLTPNLEALTYARHVLSVATIEPVAPKLESEMEGETGWRWSRPCKAQLGLMLLSTHPANPTFLISLARAFLERGLTQNLVVLGATLDDAALFACGNIFVTGPFEAEELRAVCETHRIGGLFAAQAGVIFAHPLLAGAERAGIPVARFGLTSGPVDDGLGLYLPHGAPFALIAERLARWSDRLAQ